MRTSCGSNPCFEGFSSFGHGGKTSDGAYTGNILIGPDFGIRAEQIARRLDHEQDVCFMGACGMEVGDVTWQSLVNYNGGIYVGGVGAANYAQTSRNVTSLERAAR